MRLIDADALVNNITVLFEKNKSLIDEWLRYHIEDEITEAPTIDAEPVRHGKWVKIGTIENTWLVHKCSLCGGQTIDNGAYCPACGAKMDGETI